MSDKLHKSANDFEYEVIRFKYQNDILAIKHCLYYLLRD